MEQCIRVLLFLGLPTLISSTPDEDVINKAIDTCNHNLHTDFELKFLDIPQKSQQDTGLVFNYATYLGRPRHLLGRLFPWLYKPPRYQIMLTTAWKSPLVKTNTPPDAGDTNNVLVKTCSAYLSDQDPLKYILTCNNATLERSAEKTAGVTPMNSTRNTGDVENSGNDQDEYIEDTNWNLSRCLGCIFGMLG